MKSSASSSATATSPSASTPAHKAFALTGRSRVLDPRTNAVRADIADVRLAEHVFAPHYAAPLAVRVLRSAMLREGRMADTADMVVLAAGEMFDLLDLTGDVAWGVAPAHGLVGYVDAAALGIAAI